MASTEPGSEKVFDFQENIRLYSVNAKDESNYYYDKINTNSQLRYGVILVTNNDNKGEFIEIYLQGNREEVNRAHSQKQGAGKCSYRGSITLNGRLFEDTLFIIRETEHRPLLVTFWPENQYEDIQQVGNKVITPTDYLINLSMGGYPVDPNIVAGKMHEAFVKLTKEAGINHFKPEVFMAEWDIKVKEETDLKIEDLEEQNEEKGLKIEDLEEHVDAVTEDLFAAKEQRFVANEETAEAKEETALAREETAEAKEETAAERGARKLAEERADKADKKLAEIELLGKKANTTSRETGKSSVRHTKVYTLVKTDFVTQYGKTTIEITLEDSFGNTTTSWNNWNQIPGRLRDKYAQSDALVGQKIQYDTWGGFSPQWFNNLYLVE